MTIISAQVSGDLADEVRRSAAASDRSVSAEIRRALRLYLSTNKDEAVPGKDDLVDDGLAGPPHGR